MSNLNKSMQFVKTDNYWYRVTPSGPDPFGPRSTDYLTDEEAGQARRDFAASLARLDLPQGELPPSHSNSRRQRVPYPRQRGRDTCVSFVLVAAIEGRLPGHLVDVVLSRQYAHWTIMREDNPACAGWTGWKPRLIEGARHLTGSRICLDADSPYTRYGACWRDDATSKTAEAQGKAVYGIRDWLLLCGMSYCRDTDQPIDVDCMRRLLVKGYDIAISIANYLTPDCNGTCINTVPKEEDGSPKTPNCDFVGHCLLVVGYGVDYGTSYFECIDSIDGELIRVSAGFVARYARYGIAVTDCVYP